MTWWLLGCGCGLYGRKHFETIGLFSACLVWHGAVTPKLHQAGSAVMSFSFACVCKYMCMCLYTHVEARWLPQVSFLRSCPLYSRVFSPTRPGWLTIEPRDPLATCVSPGLQEHASTSGFGFSFNIGSGALPSLYQPSHLPSSLVFFGLQGNRRVRPVWAKKSSSEQKNDT